MTELVIDNLVVSNDAPIKVIAEIGINHGGSLETAQAMVDSAARAGAQIIKHQTHIPDEEMSDHAKTAVPGNDKRSIFEIVSESALSLDDEVRLKDYVESLGLTYLSTPFSREAANFLNDLGVPAFKIGSGECNNHPLLRHIASFGKPIILSTGMNSIESVTASVRILRDAEVPYALLHCVNLYPTPYHLLNLGAIPELRARFPEAQIGFSDHSIGNYASFAAAGLGANIIERHFTDHYGRSGPDIGCSVDEDGLRDLLVGCAAISEARGGRKLELPDEEVTRGFAYASVVSIQPVIKSEVFSLENIWVKRPGTGEIPASRLDEVLGKRATRDITKGEQLLNSDYE